jgi:EAL domain-containing protein (putative c-di-GMP-specific phosphodiesterase class I)
VAEQTGQAGALDGWVLRRALADLARFKAAGVVPPGVSVSVNVSARNLAIAGLDEMVLSAITATGLLPREVTLEITEGAVMQDPSMAIGLLRRLRDHGFGIAIDDFGTGYSSLAYLRDLPITSLKIDRSFVSGIAENGDALAIATSIIDLARAVGVTTVAEGVESNAQAAVLRRLGCEAGQGWLWSRATPAAEVLAAGDWNGAMALPAPAPTDAQVGGSLVGPEHGLDRLRELDAQGASASSIAAALNRAGFRAPSGTRWHRTSVAAVLIQPDPAGGAKRVR